MTADEKEVADAIMEGFAIAGRALLKAKAPEATMMLSAAISAVMSWAPEEIQEYFAAKMAPTEPRDALKRKFLNDFPRDDYPLAHDLMEEMDK